MAGSDGRRACHPRADDLVRTSGKRAAALAQSTSSQITELKARWLGASMVDGVGGQHGTGVRGWFIYTVYGRGLTPLPCKIAMRDFEVASFWEDVLEDYAIWYVTFKPHGNERVRRDVRYVPCMNTRHVRYST